MNVDLSSGQLDGISLFAGSGLGLDEGLRLVLPRTRIICRVEREAYCCELLATRCQEASLDDAPLWTDVRTFDGKPWRGVVDFITAGWPCPPFSVAGNRRGRHDPRYLWPEVVRILGEAQPWLFLGENVPGLLNDVDAWSEVCGDLREMGYRVAAGLFSAEEVGAGHRRKRLFILGLLSDGQSTRREEAGIRCYKHTRGESQARSGIVADISTSDGRAMDDTYGSGLQGRSKNQRADKLPAFPPGPKNTDAWRYVLEIDRSLEPAICGMADGMACRMERLQCTGNGVVPLQAAYAFLSLWAALEGG